MARRQQQQTGTERAETAWPHNGHGHESVFTTLDETLLDDKLLEENALDEKLSVPDQAESTMDAPFFGSAEEPSLVDFTATDGYEFGWTGPRQPVRDVRWAATLRQFGRAAVWVMPVGVVALTLSTLWGWPTPSSEPSGASPGTWLAVTALGLASWLVGLVAIGALLASSPGRIWSAVSVVTSIAGAALLLPVVGVIGLARPAVSRTAPVIGGDAAYGLQSQFLDGTVGRWLAIGGAALLGVGALALAGAILASDVLNRLDGWFALIGIGIAFAGAYLSWEFLLTVGGMALLAASLGVAWNATRLTADGRIADTD